MTKNIEVPGFVIPGIEDITRRDFLVGGAAVLLLAGCGSPDGNEPSGEARTVEDAHGRVEIPARPQRVEAVAALDGHLVAGPATGAMGPWLKDGAEGAEQAANLSGEINLEALAKARPDLIVVNEWMVGEARDTLSEIAPLYVVPDSIFNGERDYWRKLFRMVAEALGMDKAAEEDLSQVDRRIEEIKKRFPHVSETVCSIVKPYEAGFRFYHRGTFCGDVVNDVGLKMRPVGSKEAYVERSLEEISEIDADLVFLWTWGYNEQEEEASSNASTP